MWYSEELDFVLAVRGEKDPKAGDGEKDYSVDETPFGDPDSQESDAA